MIVSIASGKGGTGKTTVAANLALSIGNVQFCDCDVEEPNANVFLHVPIIDSTDVSIKTPLIDKEKCTYCGACARFCAFHAMAVVKKQVLVFPELCHSCGGCAMVCPQDAISWKHHKVGTVETGKQEGISFVQGLLDVGESLAIPVIKAVKDRIVTDRHVIIDSPPGTACPMIESVQEADFCILVTEPTPFGLHDLKLAVNTVRHLYVPFGVIINRDGIGDKEVENYCRVEKIPILMKIPQSEDIAHMYSRGEPFVTSSTHWKQQFQQLWQRIQEEAAQ